MKRGPKKLELGTKNCLRCGKRIELKIRRDLWRKKFCCKKCSGKYYSEKGIFAHNWKKIPERVKERMRKPHRITEKLLKAQKERGLKRRKPWRWYVENGRKIRFHQSQDWRDKAKEIYKRDNFTCQKCGAKNRKLHCHHKKGVKIGKMLFDNKNLITLCEECHLREHPELHFKAKR